MKRVLFAWVGACLLIVSPPEAPAEIKVTVERLADQASPSYAFRTVPAPSAKDLAAKAEFTLVDGRLDGNGGGLDVLHDDLVALEEDQPGAAMFFQAGTEAGRFVVDLGEVQGVRQINTYSWHPAERGPQRYTLYASDGRSASFQARPGRDSDLAAGGWTKLAVVDSKPQSGEPGGQHGVSVAAEAADALLGDYRYLLFDVSRTGLDERFDQTFYTELDVLGPGPAEPVSLAAAEAKPPIVFATEDGRYEFTMEVSAAPDLAEWAERELAPVVRDWYPKIVAMLPSDGFEPPARVTIRFRTNMGGTPASASGSRINCNAGWFRRNLQGEARGSVVHEMVHVVQQYGRARRTNPDATRTPGWIVEGIPDYIRWFLYEPETKGAEITRRNLERARHDASYRITGNFLNWIVATYDREFVRKLNTAAREGNYRESLWEEWTGKNLETLGTEWREGHVKRLADAD